MDALERIVRADGVEHVVLSGDEPALHRLREELPRALRPKLVDMLQLDPRAPQHEVLQASLDALRRHEARTDVERVRRLLDDRRAGGLAVAGLRATEAALARGEAHEVLVSADPMTVREASAAEPEREAQMRLCDRLVSLARASDARVHFVEDAALLAGVGGGAAALRYRSHLRPRDAARQG
jgi:peptide subunit release factor 1 (eRF1)